MKRCYTREVVNADEYYDGVPVVVLIPDNHPPSGLWHVATAWPANRDQRRTYTSRDEAEVHDHDEPGR